MKKGITQDKVQRMRNLISGNHNNKSLIRSGYTKNIVERVEGQVWTERGKTWTIKNGIKRTVDKLDFARKINRVPFACPKCVQSLKHSAHKQMYKRWGMCLTCVVKWEAEMKANGTYDEWFKQFDVSNFNAFISDIQGEYNDWVQSRNAQHYISEAGRIEDWSCGGQGDELSKEFNKTVAKAKEQHNAKHKD